MPSVPPTQTRMTQNGSLQEAPRSPWGSLPIKAAQLGQTEKAGPRDVRRIVLEEGSTPQPWCIEWGVMSWTPPRASLWTGFGTLDVSREADSREQHWGKEECRKKLDSRERCRGFPRQVHPPGSGARCSEFRFCQFLAVLTLNRESAYS